MHKRSLKELLDFIEESIMLIRKRFEPIRTPDDFLHDDDMLARFDSIVLRIQTIGEALKNIDKHYHGFLEKAAPSLYWSQIIKLRDLISHHYVDLDADVIYMICNEKLDELDTHVQMLLQTVDEYFLEE